MISLEEKPHFPSLKLSLRYVGDSFVAIHSAVDNLLCNLMNWECAVWIMVVSVVMHNFLNFLQSASAAATEMYC